MKPTKAQKLIVGANEENKNINAFNKHQNIGCAEVTDGCSDHSQCCSGCCYDLCADGLCDKNTCRMFHPFSVPTSRPPEHHCFNILTVHPKIFRKLASMQDLGKT